MEMDIQEELYQRIDSLEAEKGYLTEQVKQLENALDKQKKFHRKFVDDVTDAEEMRIKDFHNEKKGIIEENKRLIAENRLLVKDKSFYQTEYNVLIKEADINRSNVSTKNASQLTLTPTKHNTRRSSSINEPSSTNYSSTEISVTSPKTNQHRSSKVISKASEKLFEENKKLKLKTMKLTKVNASLRLKVKQLENYKNKILNKGAQQVSDRLELQNLFDSTRRTNNQIFNAEILARLGQLSIIDRNVN